MHAAAPLVLVVVATALSAGCGTTCVDCPPPPLFAAAEPSHTTLPGGVFWLRRAGEPWRLGDRVLDAVDRTPTFDIVRVPADVVPGDYQLEAGDVTADVVVADVIGPVVSIHDRIVGQRFSIESTGGCVSSCSSDWEIQPPSRASGEDYAAVGFTMPPPDEARPEVRRFFIVDAWLPGVDTNDPDAPRVIDSVVLGEELIGLNAKTSSTTLVFRYRSFLDPEQMTPPTEVRAVD